MANVIKLITAIRRKIHLGFPDGYNEDARKDLSVLIRRIDELERAVVPFGRLARVPNNTDKYLLCNREDCLIAADVMDGAMSVELQVENFGTLLA